MEFIENALDFLFNKRIKTQMNVPNCSIVLGQKRAGKSTLSALSSSYYNKLGYRVFSNYPVKDTYALPMKVTVNKQKKPVVTLDKDFLYDTMLDDSVILIDEGANYWPARQNGSDWSSRDTEFFTMMSHHNIRIIINVQYFNLIDVNVKRACDEIFFITKNKWLPGLSNVAVSELVSLPVANLNAQIMSKSCKGAYPISYDLCELPIADYHMYRKKYYGDFDTHFDYKIYERKLKLDDLELWNKTHNFD